MRDDAAFAQSSAVAVAERPAGLNRRQLLRAGAWAAPALVLATAAPAAAASTPTPTIPTYRAATAVAIKPQIGSSQAGTIVVHYCALKYDYSEWSLPGKLESSGPSLATFTYSFDVLNQAGAVVKNVSTNAVATVAKYQQTALSPTITGLAPGTYRLRLTITSATFTGQTMSANFIATLPVVAISSSVKVS